jgi:hypothetical protein
MDGDVGIPPFPDWVARPEFLVSLGHLLRRIHDALDNGNRPPTPSGRRNSPIRTAAR